MAVGKNYRKHIAEMAQIGREMKKPKQARDLTLGDLKDLRWLIEKKGVRKTPLIPGC